MLMPKIAVRCNPSHLRGMGNIFRQLYLGKIPRERGMDVVFYLPEYPPACALLKKEGFTSHPSQANVGLPPNASDHFDLIILDILDTTKEGIQSLRPRCKRIVSFEDLGPGRNHVDLLIDCNLEPEQAEHIADRVKVLFGLPYSTLSPDFSLYHDRKRHFPPILENCLISLGGTDPNNLTLKLAKLLLHKKRKLKITVLAGPGFSDSENIARLQSEQLTVLSNISNMAETLFAHQAIVCSGGVTLHEALAVGTPAFVVNQVPHQEDKARFLQSKGAAINLGLGNNFDVQKLLESLDMGMEEREELSRAGKALIDGQGIHRVADELIHMAKKGS